MTNNNQWHATHVIPFMPATPKYTMQRNNELRLAWEFVEHTGVSVFLTGKAGTGKTTFLRTLRNRSTKTMVVVAPTGVAAINAEGVTIHSFFQLPLSPYVPGAHIAEKYNFSKEKLRIIRALDLLVIDEISMVRSDLLDAIDNALRKYRRSNLPFGGVQLLMIGDLRQLAPVVTPADEQLLRGHYSTPYFFGSRALAQIQYVTIELTTVYRQNNEQFINLLNNLRDNQLTKTDFALLRSRLNPSFRPQAGDNFIRLTTHNHMADSYNSKELSLLSTSARCYRAKVKGIFPETSFPNPENLQLKVGAQVMFLKNDMSGESRYYNGKIGRIVKLNHDSVEVLCPDNSEPIKVEAEVWENTHYSINEESNTIETEVQGTFSQLPLRLAWAITIHKSQGLTFDKVIIDAGAAFAPGQVYVALSRCRTLEGIVLATDIAGAHLGTDTAVEGYINDRQTSAAESLEKLPDIKKDYFRHLLAELFNFSNLTNLQASLLRQITTAFQHQFPSQYAQQSTIAIELREKIVAVADKWMQLVNAGTMETLNSDSFADRVRKGCTYFAETLKEIFADSISEASKVRSDNKKATQRVKEIIMDLNTELRKDLGILFAVAEHGFSVTTYLKFKEKAMLAATQGDTTAKKTKAGKLKKENISYIDKKPKTPQSATSSRQTVPKEKKAKAITPAKPLSYTVSYEMFRKGSTVEEIAAERSIQPATVINHLMHYVENGSLQLTDLFSPMKVNAVASVMSINSDDTPTMELHRQLPSDFDIVELMHIRAILRRQTQLKDTPSNFASEK